MSIQQFQEPPHFPKSAFGKDIRDLWKRNEIHGIELLFDTAIIALRVVSVSYWLKDGWLPWFLRKWGVSEARTRRIYRDNLIDGYCVFQLLLLLGLLCQVRCSRVSSWVAVYILFEMYLNLFSILLIPRRAQIGPPNPSDWGKVNEPSTGAERSILLIFLNVCQLILAFAIFYVSSVPGLSRLDAFRGTALVFGTLGAPDSFPRSLVVAQVFLDFLLVVMALGAVVGRIGGFVRDRRSETSVVKVAGESKEVSD